jgi:hypothetical protein
MTKRAAPALPFALAALLLVAAPACGVRTDPRPPEDTAARAPEDFQARIMEGKVELTWERTTKTVDGRRLYDLERFDVERRSAGGELETLAEIPVTDTDRLRTQQVFEYIDHSPPAGAVEYRVRAVAADGEKGVPSALEVELPAR